MNRLPCYVLLGGVLLASLLGPGGCSSIWQDDTDVHVIVDNVAWTWFTDERAIVVDSFLYVGHVDTAGATRVTTYLIRASGDSGRDTTVRLSTYREVDDHNNPALLRLEDGRTLAAYAQHHEAPYWYWRFEKGDHESFQWSSERRSTSVGARVTYNNLFQLSGENGRIYNVFRGLNFDPTMMTSEDGGQTWSAPRHVLRSGGSGTRPYVKYVSNGEDRIDLLYTQGHPRQKKNDVYHLYYQDRVFHRSDGTRICHVKTEGCLPVQVDRGTLVYDADEAGRAWVWDVEYTEEGEPVGVYVTARDSTVGRDLRYRYARYDAETSTWTEQEIAHAGTRLYEGENHYAGGIALDPEDVGRVYLSADVHPETVGSTASGQYQIYEGTAENQEWTWTQITESSAADNLRPFVPRGADEHQVVLWLRGEYTTYTDYDTNVVGIIQ